MLTLCFQASLIACAWCLLLGLLVMRRSKIITSKANTRASVSDLLDYAVLEDDVVILKSGAILRCYELEVPDMSNMTDTQIEHLYKLNQKALLKLCNNFCLQIDVIRNKDHGYLPNLEHDHEVLCDIEQKRAELFKKEGSLHTRIIMSITYLPEGSHSRKIDKLVLQDFNNANQYEAVKNLINEFKGVCQSVIDTLELTMQVRPLGKEQLDEAFIKAKAQGLAQSHGHSNGSGMGYGQGYGHGQGNDGRARVRHGVVNNELLSFINQCVCAKEQKIAHPGAHVFLDSVLSNYDIINGDTPKVDNKLLSIIAIEGLPSYSHEGMLNALGTLPFCYRYNTRFIYFDQLKSRNLLSKYRRFWAQKSKGFMAQLFNLENARVNQNALDQMHDIDEATRALDNNEVVFGSYSACLILADESYERLINKTKLAIKAIESTSLCARVETLNAFDAYLGTLPGHFFENLRRPIVSQDVLLDMIPLSLPVKGERYCPNNMYGPERSPLMQVRTTGQSCYYLNLHDSDLGNTLVIGPTGAGKSVFLGSLILNLSRYRDMRLFVFDKGCSFYALTKALNGQHITFNNSQAMLCPLYKLESELDCDYALSFLELLLELNDYHISPSEKNELIECLHILKGKEPSERSLSELHLTLASRPLKEALAPYTKVNAQHCILDGSRNLAIGHGLCTFECADIFKSSSAFSLPVLKQVFHLLQEQFDGHPGAIILDEAWLMLQDEHFASELIKWFKTLRKYNVMVILATQSLSDLQSSPHFLNLLECAKTRVYLANYDANTQALHDTYELMGLSDSEITKIANGVPKKDYYFVKGDQRIMFNLLMSKEELNLLSFAGDHQVALIDELYRRFGPNFYHYYQQFGAKALASYDLNSLINKLNAYEQEQHLKAAPAQVQMQAPAQEHKLTLERQLLHPKMSLAHFQDGA